jgi:putative ABC transport system permease protein
MAARPVAEQAFGLYLAVEWLDAREILILVGIIAAGTFVGLLPGLRAYRNSVVDGMTVRT